MIRRDPNFGGIRTNIPSTSASCHQIRIDSERTYGSPQELRHTFVSLLSENGMLIEEIADLVGHSSTPTTETVYRRQLRPVLRGGAVTMVEIFGQRAEAADQGEDGAEKP